MKVLFLYPPSIYLNHAMFKHFTYFAETANLLSGDGYDINVLDCGVELFNRREIYQKLKCTEVLIVLVEPYTIRTTLSISKITKEINPNCKIVFYGTAAALIPNYLSNNSVADYIIADGFFYEGISKALNLIESDINSDVVTNTNTVSKILKSSFHRIKKKWGNPISELVPIENYRKYGNNMFEFTVQTGCPYNCSFCSEKILFKDEDRLIYEQRPLDSVISVVSQAVSYHFSSLYFSATTFTYDREWVLDICKSMIQEGISIPWRSDTRIDRLDRELVKMMKKAGLSQLSIGIESFEDRLLKGVNKGIASHNIENQIKMVQSEGVSIKALLILGIPGQTAEDVRHTKQIVQKLKIPYRWKEYSPIRELFIADKNGEDIESVIDSFDRTAFNTSSVEGISPTEYMELLFPDDYKR